MLPKIWKKFLLAICIIACIYNVMSKIVNRNSLEVNLKSVDDGTTVFNLFQKDENIVEETLIQEETNNNQVSAEINQEENVSKPIEEEVSQEPEEKQEETKSNKKTEFIVLY